VPDVIVVRDARSASDSTGKARTDIGYAYVDAAHLARYEFLVRGLTFLPRQKRRSILSGLHASRLRGRGLNFEEIRAYQQGDDVRTIDWHVTVRTGTAHVRAYTEERDRPAFFVVDQSMSMFFGSQRALKSVVAAEVAAIGCWMAFRAGDRIGAVVFNDTGLVHIKPHRSRNRLHQIFGEIVRQNQRLSAAHPPVGPQGRLNEALQQVLRIAVHDCLVCVISDFAGANDETLRLLREIAIHNDVVGALVFDPLAENLSPRGQVVVSQGELQIEFDLASGTVHEPLSTFFSTRLASVAELLRRTGAPLLAFDTAEDTLRQLSRELGNVQRPRR